MRHNAEQIWQNIFHFLFSKFPKVRHMCLPYSIPKKIRPYIGRHLRHFSTQNSASELPANIAHFDPMRDRSIAQGGVVPPLRTPVRRRTGANSIPRGMEASRKAATCRHCALRHLVVPKPSEPANFPGRPLPNRAIFCKTIEVRLW